MLQKIIFILIIANFAFLGLKAQKTHYAINYNFKWVTDTSIMSYAEAETYILFKKDQESRFLNSYAYHNDTLHYNFMKNETKGISKQESLNIFMATVSPKYKRFKSDLRILKDFRNKEITTVLFGTYGRHYLKEPFQLKWELVNETDTIKGLICYKAITKHGGRTYMVWYTPQIPIQDGPYVFHGLPGLIAKVVDSELWYHFELEQFDVSPETDLVTPPFLTPSWRQEVDRSTYIKNSRMEKEHPKYKVYYKKVTPEIQAALNERRRTRFDLIIEKQ